MARRDLEYVRQYRAEHLEQARAAGREWYRRNADEVNDKLRQRLQEDTELQEKVRATSRASSQRYHAANRDRLVRDMQVRKAQHPEKTRAYKLKKEYNMTHEDYHHMLISQCGCCAMCGKQSTNLLIDHCHTEGHVRALLCNTCNAGLGFHEMPGFNEMAEGYKASHTKEKMQCLKANYPT